MPRYCQKKPCCPEYMAPTRYARLKAHKFNGGIVRRFLKRRWYNFLIPRIAWFVSGKSGKEAYSKGACKKIPQWVK